MNIYGRFTAAIGSVTLNAALALALAQGAAAAVPSPGASVQVVHVSAYSGARQLLAHERCSSGLRTRTIIAVVLGLIV